MKHVFRTVLYCWLIVGVLAVRPIMAQNPASVAVAQSRPPLPPYTEPPDQDRSMTEIQNRQRREANKQRQEELKRDADKLLQLATELKLYVDKSNENVLSLNVMRKAQEIEKLAKSVKEKMKGSY